MTVAREIMRQIPQERIVYFGDTARVPYGSKSTDTLIRYTRQIIRFLKTRGVKAIVVACNTASAVALEAVRDELDIPIIGVVRPGARVAAQATKNKKIGVIGTNGTINSGAYEAIIKRHGANAYSKACPLFVPLVENGYTNKDNQVTKLVAQDYLKPIIEKDVDTLILGCTHFPIIYDIISEVMDYSVVMVDPGKATAEYVRKYLIQNGMLADSEKSGEEHFFVSDSVEDFSKTASIFLGYDVKGEVERVDIERF